MESVEVGLRREAARRRLAGESPRAIARDLGRTRQWVAKWTGRYDPHDPVWAEGRSRVPGRVANRTDAGIEARVLEVRTRLEENPWAQIGAPAVGWELEKLGAVVPLSARSSGSLSLAAPRTASGPLAARRQAGEATARQPQLRTDGERVGAEHEGVGCASGQQRPQDVGIGGAVQAHEEPAEAQRGDQRQLDARPSGVSSRRASTTPTAAAAMPASCSPPGLSPVARPTMTGTAAPVAEIGATMLIVPSERAR